MQARKHTRAIAGWRPVGAEADGRTGRLVEPAAPAGALAFPTPFRSARNPGQPEPVIQRLAEIIGCRTAEEVAQEIKQHRRHHYVLARAHPTVCRWNLVTGEDVGALSQVVEAMNHVVLQKIVLQAGVVHGAVEEEGEVGVRAGVTQRRGDVAGKREVVADSRAAAPVVGAAEYVGVGEVDVAVVVIDIGNLIVVAGTDLEDRYIIMADDHESGVAAADGGER